MSTDLTHRDRALREADLGQGYRHGIRRIPITLYHCEIPSTAAVNGAAIGAGCDPVLMCDMRTASTATTFAEGFVKVRIVPGDGEAWLLPPAVGMVRASEMAYTGEAIDADTALQWGLVGSVVESDELLGAAHILAQRV